MSKRPIDRNALLKLAAAVLEVVARIMDRWP